MRVIFRHLLLASLALCLFSSVGACAVPASGADRAPDEVSSRTEAIVNGERTDGNEQAVVMVYDRAGGLCTGTLITPRVVLTAKHCVQRPGASAPASPGNFIVGVGDNINGLSQTFRVNAVRTTPGVWNETSDGRITGALFGIDVGLLTLTTGSTIPPIPVHRDSPGALIGQPARAVGFGQTPSTGGSAGVKYRVMTSAIGVMGGVVFTGPTICQGDSGGPLIWPDGPDGDEVFGVASFGQGCGVGENGYNRIDTFLDLIDEVVGDSGGCLNNGAEVCDGFDNDCNGEVDETCKAIGEACTDDAECITLTCADTSAGHICTQACDPLTPFVGCPPTDHCSRTTGCDGYCVPGAAGSAGIGVACTTDTDCDSLNCMDPGDGVQRCLDPCQGDAGMCLAGEVCAAGVDVCGGCVPAEIVTGARGLGEACTADEACGSGSCLTDGDASYCTRACSADSECGDAYHCRVMGDAGVCVVGARAEAGSPCNVNADCVNGLFCAAQAEARWCTNFCSGDSDCPTTFSCVEVAPDTRVCAPGTAGLLGSSCADSSECISGFCQPVGPDGELRCSRICGVGSSCGPGFECVRASGGLDAVCVAVPPAPRAGGGCALQPPHSGSDVPMWPVATLGLLGLFVARRRVRS